MKRFPFVIGATVAGLAGVLSFHSRSTAHPLGATSGVSAGSSGPDSPASSSHTTSPSGTSTPGTTSGAGSSSASSGAQPGGSSTTAVGGAYQYGYGVLSVRVSMSGSKIADVKVVTLRTADSYSQQIADQVVPMLRREVLTAQSAQIDAISGATYTSEAYAASVKSALGKLRSS